MNYSRGEDKLCVQHGAKLIYNQLGCLYRHLGANSDSAACFLICIISQHVLHRVLCPRSHRLHPMNRGVYEPLAVRIARSYSVTTVQFIITGGFITRLCLSEVARCTQRGFFEATAGDCDDLDTTSCQHGMNGDHIDEDNCK